MLNKKCLFLTTASIFFSFLGVSAVDAQNPQCYTLASLQGSAIERRNRALAQIAKK